MGTSLEPLYLGGSNEYPKSIFRAKIRKQLKTFHLNKDEDYHFIAFKVTACHRSGVKMIFIPRKKFCTLWVLGKLDFNQALLKNHFVTNG